MNSRERFVRTNLFQSVDHVPSFDYRVLEEDEKTIVFHGFDGIVHKALKEGKYT